MPSQRNTEAAVEQASREDRERELNALAEYPSGRQSLLSIFLPRHDYGSEIPYYESSQQLIDDILAKELPENCGAGASAQPGNTDAR